MRAWRILELRWTLDIQMAYSTEEQLRPVIARLRYSPEAPFSCRALNGDAGEHCRHQLAEEGLLDGLLDRSQ